MNTLPQAELRAMLHGKGFVRVASQPDTLWVTDACRRMDSGEQDDFIKTLAQAGYHVWPTKRGLWDIDPDDERWQAIWKTWQDQRDSGIPDNPAHLDVYALARLLDAHPALLKEQPRDALRTMLKSCDGKGNIACAATVLIQTCAEALRMQKPLPSAGAGLLFAWLREHRGVEE